MDNFSKICFNRSMLIIIRYRNMRYRIFREKTYILLEQSPISVADFNAIAARNCEGTEQLRIL